MRVRYNQETDEVVTDAAELAAFARKKADAPHGFRQSMGDNGIGDAESGVLTDVPVSVVRPLGELQCHICGTVQAVLKDPVMPVCEFRRRVRRNPAFVFPGDDPVFLAQAMLCTAMMAEAESWECIAIRLVFTRENDGAVRCWEGMFARVLLVRALDTLYARAVPFLQVEAERCGVGRLRLAKLRFPYPSVREGQRDFMETLFRCARSGRPLLVSAPTGIGKTMSSVYPALRSIGAGYADRIFYFTAKTVTGNTALDAIRALRRQSDSLRCIRLTAKERVCPRRRSGESEYGMCRKCRNMSSDGALSYEERRDAALLKVLRECPVADSPDIIRIAEEYMVCPYELSLDASEYCEMIICDYGYLLDPHVRLQRYFVADRPEKYIFLLDEAHNLPDRAREIFSAELGRKQFAAFAETARDSLPDDTPLSDACDLMAAMLDGVDALCGENAEENDEGERTGCVLQKELPAFVSSAVARLRAVCDEYLRRDYENAAPLFEDMRTVLRRWGETVGRADDSFRFYAESAGGETKLRLMCLDPSGPLHELFARAVTTVLFSATLSPMDYYADVCGCRNAEILELPSPYERENLCLVTVDSVSTRFSQRKNSAADVAEMIAAVTESREGNYIVYFPSYKYMTQVCRHYLRLAAGTHVIMQKQGMTIGERDRFLREFAKCAKRGEGVTAFCVLGGIFSEGIDLRGESLIGTVIVGIGLPGLSSELNILTEYYDQTRENGHDYAYLYPAINKILQAAGRVIRSEDDRGVVVLIDDRYADPGIRRLFPAHWDRMQYTGDLYTLSVILERFWESGEDFS